MTVSLFRQDVELGRPVRASRQVHQRRSRLFLRLDLEGHLGFGEVAPQPFALNGDPGVEDVLDALGGVLARVRGVLAREGALPSWTRVSRVVAGSAAPRVAAALVEMALLDRELRVAKRHVSELWPPVFETPTQVTVSILDQNSEWVLPHEVRRVRVKVAPGPLPAWALERLSHVAVPVLVDYNCSATSVTEVLAQVRQLQSVVTLDAVEQPFAVGNVSEHARLAAHLEVAVSIDEGVRSTRDVDQIAHYAAASMVCVKPARVGGLASARAVFARANELGLRAYLGGFFESPYARYVHRALAHATTNEASDLAPVLVRNHVRGPDQVRATGFSFGVEPSKDLLESIQELSLGSEGEF